MNSASKSKVYNELVNLISGKVLINEPMLNHTSFKTGGPADCLIVPSNSEDIYNSIKFCKDKNIDFFVIGAGTNILIPDKGINGVILKVDSTIDTLIIDENIIRAGAGLKIHKLLQEIRNKSLEGLEFLAGIPGTIGGLTCMNAGTGINSIGKYINTGDIFDIEKMNINSYSNSDFNFDYRFSSIQISKFIILGIKMTLKFGDYNEISEKIKVNLDKRIRTQPLSYPNAGCIWRNPPDKSAGKLIEEAGLKGFSIGGASVSRMHANFIINENNATSEDIYNLINHIEEVIYRKDKIKLEREIKIIG